MTRTADAARPERARIPTHARHAAGLLLLLASAHAAAQETRFSEQEVSFHNDAVELEGTLILPAGEGPHPAVVFLHGSGPATRAGARSYAVEFAELGIASLLFDKRGCGSSGGSWLIASLEDLAGDARAAVERLRAEASVDPARIGLWGVSQAGWVATLATAQSKDIAFLILISGGGASPRVSELFSYGRAFDRAGLSDAERAEAEEALDAYFRYLATGEGRVELVARLDEARASRWYPHARLDRILPSEEGRAAWSWVATWDPAPHIARIECPVLLMFGDRDTDHPTTESVEQWRAGLQEARNEHVTVMIFPGAGHGIRMRDGYAGSGRPPFADGYMEVMLGWLWRHVAER